MRGEHVLLFRQHYFISLVGDPNQVSFNNQQQYAKPIYAAYWPVNCAYMMTTRKCYPLNA